jgi:hypothetical protein
MKSYRISLLLLALWATSAISDEESAKVSTDFSGTRAGKSYTGRQYDITWSRIEYDGRKVQNWIGGDSLDPPRYVFKSVALVVDGAEVPVPANLYSDIYDPASYGPFVTDDGEILFLVIKAGDGAGSAEAWMRIEENRIVQRRVKQFGPDGEYKFRN